MSVELFLRLFGSGWRHDQSGSCSCFGSEAEGSNKADEINSKPTAAAVCRLPRCERRVRCDRQRSGDPCEQGADQPAANVRGEAFAGASQMDRINARQVVSPEAELRDGHRRRQEDADVGEADSRRQKPNTIGIRIRPGIWKARSSQRRLMMMASTARRQRPTRPPISCTFVTFAATLVLFAPQCRARLAPFRPPVYPSFRRQRQSAPALSLQADRARSAGCVELRQGRAVTHRKHQRRDQRRASQLGRKAPRKLGRLGVPASRFCCHVGDSGRKGRMMINGMAGINPDIIVYRHARADPSTPRPLRNSGMWMGKIMCPGYRQSVCHRHEQAAHGGKRLCITEHPLALWDAGKAPPARRRPRQTRRKRRRKQNTSAPAASSAKSRSPSKGCERIDEDAPRQRGVFPADR